MKKDFNKIAKIEKAIAKKYGKQAIINPRSGWNTEKETSYLEEVKKFYARLENNREKRKKLAAHRAVGLNACPVCSKVLLSSYDEVSIKKHSCCDDCYVDYVEGREQRWKDGWRPDKESVFRKN